MAKRGPKTKEENEVLRKNVFKRPEFLDAMPSKGQVGRQIALLSVKLKAMGSDETVAHSVNEFSELFAVKNGDIQKTLNYCRAQLRNIYDIPNPRLHLETSTGKIYIWRGHAK